MLKTTWGLLAGALCLGLLAAACGQTSAPEGTDLIRTPRYAELAGRRTTIPFVLAQPTLQHHGWHRGDTPLWARLPKANLELPLATDDEGRYLAFSVRRHESLSEDVTVQVSFNGEPVGVFRARVEEAEVRFALTKKVQRAGRNRLDFEIDAWQRFVKDPGAPRRHWIAFSRISLEPQDTDGPAGHPEIKDGALWLPAATRAAFYFDGGGRASLWPLETWEQKRLSASPSSTTVKREATS